MNSIEEFPTVISYMVRGDFLKSIQSKRMEVLVHTYNIVCVFDTTTVSPKIFMNKEGSTIL